MSITLSSSYPCLGRWWAEEGWADKVIACVLQKTLREIRNKLSMLRCLIDVDIEDFVWSYWNLSLLKLDL